MTNNLIQCRSSLIFAVVLFSALFFSNLITSPVFSQTKFEQLVKNGLSALSNVQELPDDGQGHLSPGQSHEYSSEYPTSGTHATSPVAAGFYRKPQQPTQLVHALEHGNIVIYFGKVGPKQGTFILKETKNFNGFWDGVIFIHTPKLGNKTVATAWRKRLDLDNFDLPSIAAFIDAFRGRGPENRVR